MSTLSREEVTSVHHWTDTLFSFKTTRQPAFRFRSGQFAMIGLEVSGRPLLRAYSMASADYDDHLEFFSIKVPNGPLTSRLQHLKVGDSVLLNGKPTGTLLLDNLLPGRNLYLMATGTGLAPFLSLIRNPEVYERYERVVLVHGCRWTAELAYEKMIAEELPVHELLGDLVSKQLLYYPAVTREAFRNRGRLTDLVTTGKLNDDLGLAPLSAAEDRMMMCGSPDMLRDLVEIVRERGFAEGNSSEPGQFVIEKAFVER